MRHGRKLTIYCLGGFVLAAGANAVTADNPFQSIVDRNVFALKAPPPPPPPPEPPKPPLPPINLTGIMTMGGKKRALLEAVMPAKPPDQPKKSFYTLGEQERQDEVQVLTIDEKNGTVQIKLMEVVTNLTFASKMPPATAPGAPPGAPGQLVPGVPPPINPGMPTGVPGGVQRTLPGRPLRGNAADGAVNPATGYPGQGAANAYGQPQANTAPQLTRDENALVIEAERERLRQSGDPLANLMPVTHLTPSGAPGTGVTAGDVNPEGATPNLNPTPTIRRRSTPLPQ